MSAFDNMFARLTNPASRLEGSFCSDNLRAVGNEIDRIQAEGIENMPNLFFPHLATGDALTTAASNWGVDRKSAQAATVTVTIAGAAGAALAAGMRVQTTDDIFFTLDAPATLPASGIANAMATAEVAGSGGNVAAGTIVAFAESYSGLSTVINSEGASGGADEESDADLKLRLDARWKNPSTGGNISDYQRWALDVNGVSRVKVTNPSAGNVTVTLVGAGNVAAGSTLIAAVQAAIEAVRPVGALVTVQSGAARTLAVTASVRLMAGYTLQGVTADIQAALSAYFERLAFASTVVSYAKIADILFADGVADVTVYTLGGGTVSVTLLDDEFPKLGEVTITNADA